MIEINKKYSFECDASFGTLSQERVNELFTDGRRASGFLELQLEEWFPSLHLTSGKGYDHMIVDPKNPKKGILEMRPIDAGKIKKVAEVIKEKDDNTGATVITGVKEKYVYRDKPNDSSALEIPPEAVLHSHSGITDP